MSDYLRLEEQEKLLHEIADCIACENTVIGFCGTHQSRYDKIKKELFPLGRHFVHMAYVAKEHGYVPHA